MFCVFHVRVFFNESRSYFLGVNNIKGKKERERHFNETLIRKELNLTTPFLVLKSTVEQILKQCSIPLRLVMMDSPLTFILQR